MLKANGSNQGKFYLVSRKISEGYNLWIWGCDMPVKANHRNEYQCTIEVNQNGKYCVRVRAVFTRKAWTLPVYFLASTFDRAMTKLEQTLQFLQQQEERLWFWGG